jgi:copper transport protein
MGRTGGWGVPWAAMRTPAPRRACLLGAAASALAAGLLAATLLAGGAAPAGAHATLIGTVPAADGVVDAVPAAVELRFDEPVELVDDAVQVFGPDGGPVDEGTVETRDAGATLVAPIGGDAQGTYTVAWRVTSEDSHTLSGSFVFHNGTRTGAVDVDEGDSTATDIFGGVARWLGYAGTMTAVGAAAVALLLPHSTPGDRGTDDGVAAPGEPGEPTGAGGRPAGSGAPLDGAGPGGATATLTAPAPPGTAPRVASEDTRALLRVLVAGGAIVGAVGAFLALVAILAEGAGRNVYDALALVTDAAPETRTVQLALLRVALTAAAAAAALIPVVWRRAPAAVLALGGAALVVTTLAGHAWTAPNRWVAVVSDVIHLGAVSVWIGGLVALLAVLPLLGRATRARLATRFSALAVGVVVVVAASGTVSGWQQVRTLDGLTSTAYGRLLLAKVAGFAVLVVLGWLNRVRLVPLVERTLGPLRRSLRVELTVAAVVLALTAALVHQSPARSAASDGPFDTTVEADAGQVLSATVDPAEAGPNDIHLYFTDASGEPLAVDAVQVTAGTTDVPSRRLQVTPVSTDHVTVAGASLPSPGTWTVEVTAVQAGQPLVFTFEVPIS